MDRITETTHSAQTKSDHATHKLSTITSSLTAAEEELRQEKERVVHATNKLQNKEIAMAALNGKLELVSAELQSKVLTKDDCHISTTAQSCYSDTLYTS